MAVGVGEYICVGGVCTSDAVVVAGVAVVVVAYGCKCCGVVVAYRGKVEGVVR